MFARDPRTMPMLFLFIGFVLLAYGVNKQRDVDFWTEERIASEVLSNQQIDDLVYANTGESISGAENPDNREERHQAINTALRSQVTDARKSARNVLIGASFLIVFMLLAIFNLWRHGAFKRDA